MTKEKYETREIWTTGRRDGIACVKATIYPRKIVATADAQRITKCQMEKALAREFPRHAFYTYAHETNWLRCDADRFTDDGV